MSMISRCRLPELLTIFFAPLVAFADAYPVNKFVDVAHYRFELTLSDETDNVRGTASIQVIFLRQGIGQFRLDLVNRSVDRDGRGMVVDSVSHNDSPLEFVHDKDTLLIELPTPSRLNDSLNFKIRYSGIPATGLQIRENKHGERTFFSDNWPDKARNWLPTVDHISDKATSEFLVTAPVHYQIVSNGLLQEESNLDGQLRLTHWKQSVPTAPWLYVLAAADFAVQYVDEYDHKSIQTWVYHQDRDAGFFDFAVPTRQALEYFSNNVGPFAYEKLANIQANSVGGGMEAASAILYGDDSVTGKRTPRWRYVIVHEIAHQWFGNAVTEANWDDVWLSEGFATYFSQLFFEHADGHDAFVENMIEIRDRIFEFHADHPDYRIVHEDLSDMSKVTTRQTYDKGAWVLHMLKNKIGNENWWRGIQSYYLRHMNSHAATEDFREEMEGACECDLRPFFDQWLFQGGNIVLDGQWHFDESTGSAEVVLTQTQYDNFRFSVDVEIGVYSNENSLPAIHHLPLIGRTGRLSIPLESRPAKILLDPRTVFLAQWTFTENKSE